MKEGYAIEFPTKSMVLKRFGRRREGRPDQRRAPLGIVEPNERTHPANYSAFQRFTNYAGSRFETQCFSLGSMPEAVTKPTVIDGTDFMNENHGDSPGGTIPLEPNVWASRVLFPFLSGVFIFIGLPAFILILMRRVGVEYEPLRLFLSRPAPAWMPPIAPVIVGLFYFGVRRKAAGPPLTCSLEDKAIIVRHKNKLVCSSPVAEIELTRGHYTITSRYARGELPVLGMRFPGNDRELFIGVRDSQLYCQWRDESSLNGEPRKSQRLMEPTHFVSGWAWVKLTTHLGLGEEVNLTRL